MQSSENRIKRSNQSPIKNPPFKKQRRILKIDIDEINSDNGITDTESNTSTPITIPEHLQKLKSDMINYTYMLDGDFGDNFLGKIKQQYVKKDDGITIGVRLFYFKNKSNKDENGTFTKVFAYSNRPELEPDNVLIKILSEVYYHIEFSKLQTSCNFRVPKLIEYGFIKHNNDENIKIVDDDFIFYIKMEDVDAKPVTKLNELYDDNVLLDKCIDIETEVNRINACLQNNNLYHNDLHTDNVMIDKNGELIIIDFGESSNILQRLLKEEEFCGRFKKKGGANKKGRTIRKITCGHMSKKMRGVSKNRRRHMSKKMRGMSKNRRRISKKRKI